MGKPQAATVVSEMTPSPAFSQSVLCPLVLGLDAVVPLLHSPVTDTQGHTLIEYLFCARH